MTRKLVLAYSGGLDTSVALRWLREKGYEVIAYLADVGQGSNFSIVEKRAYAAGASKVIIEDLKKEFVEDFIFPALKAGAVYESKYFLSTALSRPLIAKGLVKAAKKEKAECIAHGCTGKGNDQVRFELSIGILAPDIEIIAPVREWELVSRGHEIRYAKMHKLPIDVSKKSPYSLDKNLWGISIEAGKLEDPWNEAPEEAYQLSVNPEKAPSRPLKIEIYFEKGIPRKLNGKKLNGVELIKKLNHFGGKHGIGRADLVENRLVGIKSREIYEAPAAVILHAAHEALENIVLDRETFYFKNMTSLKYGQLVYYGLWYTPLKKALDSFVNETQKAVTGSIRLRLYKGSTAVLGRKSVKSLYKKELATYGEDDRFDQSLAEGFIKLWGMPYKNQKLNIPALPAGRKNQK
ncbi:MAG: argininosuccinate synthase [Candidatus Omnitrophota bacterium]|nr:argininosuccinate synthase [Candidatus Omnitrophota bacterium]